MLHIKQGATLLLTCVMTDVTGAPIGLNAAQLAVALKTATGVVIGPITISAASAPGQAIVLALASDTANWPVGILRGDISVTGSGITTISQTFMLFIEQAIT